MEPKKQPAPFFPLMAANQFDIMRAIDRGSSGRPQPATDADREMLKFFKGRKGLFAEAFTAELEKKLAQPIKPKKKWWGLF